MLNTQFATLADPDPYQGIYPVLESKETFMPTILSEEDIPAFLALQKKVRDALLPLNQQHFLKERNKADLKIHLDNRMPIIGVKNRFGDLVAQALVSYPFYAEAVKNLGGYPLNGYEATTAIVQSLAVDPDHSGKKLSQMILETAKDMALMSGHVQILAKVADDNRGSAKSFLNSAFRAVSHGKDLNEKYAVTYWKYSIYQGCSAASATLALGAKIA